MFRTYDAAEGSPRKFNNHLSVFIREVLQKNWTLTSSQIIQLFQEQYPDEERQLKPGLISVMRSQMRKADPMIDEYPTKPDQKPASTRTRLDQLLGDSDEDEDYSEDRPEPEETIETHPASRAKLLPPPCEVKQSQVSSPPVEVKNAAARALEILSMPPHRQDLQRIEATLDRLIVTLADAEQVDADSWPYRFLLDSRRRISAMLVSPLMSGTVSDVS